MLVWVNQIATVAGVGHWPRVTTGLKWLHCSWVPFAWITLCCAGKRAWDSLCLVSVLVEEVAALSG